MQTKDIYFIIQVRNGSTRLPSKMSTVFYDNKTIPEIIIERFAKVIDLNRIIIATTTNPSDDVLVERLSKLGCKVFRGDEDNVLKRFIDAAEFFSANYFFRVCADNPFLNVDLYNKIISVENLNNYDYVSFYQDKNPAIKTHYGLFVEYSTLKTLKRIASSTNEKINIEHVTPFIYNNEELFKIKKIEMPKLLLSNNWLRLTIDTKDDFDNSKLLFENIDNKNDLKEIIFKAEQLGLKESMINEITKNSK